MMQAIEFETVIKPNGDIHIPEQYRRTYGQRARLVVLLPEEPVSARQDRQPGSAKGRLRVLSEDDQYLADFGDYMPCD